MKKDTVKISKNFDNYYHLTLYTDKVKLHDEAIVEIDEDSREITINTIIPIDYNSKPKKFTKMRKQLRTGIKINDESSIPDKRLDLEFEDDDTIIKIYY